MVCDHRDHLVARRDREDGSDSRHPQQAPHTTSTARYGHAAVISGICSLAATHEQPAPARAARCDASILAGSVLGLTSPHIPALSAPVGARVILACCAEGERDVVASTGIDSWIWAWDLRAAAGGQAGALRLSVVSVSSCVVRSAMLWGAAPWREQRLRRRRRGREARVVLALLRLFVLPLALRAFSFHLLASTMLTHPSPPSAERLPPAHAAARAPLPKMYGIDWSPRVCDELVTCALDGEIKVGCPAFPIPFCFVCGVFLDAMGTEEGEMARLRGTLGSRGPTRSLVTASGRGCCACSLFSVGEAYFALWCPTHRAFGWPWCFAHNPGLEEHCGHVVPLLFSLSSRDSSGVVAKTSGKGGLSTAGGCMAVPTFCQTATPRITATGASISVPFSLVLLPSIHLFSLLPKPPSYLPRSSPDPISVAGTTPDSMHRRTRPPTPSARRTRCGARGTYIWARSAESTAARGDGAGMYAFGPSPARSRASSGSSPQRTCRARKRRRDEDDDSDSEVEDEGRRRRWAGGREGGEWDGDGEGYAGWGGDELVEVFEGHTDVVKEFFGDAVLHIDGTAFQLITWSKDRTLRFWPVDAETMAKVGYVRPAEPLPRSMPTPATHDPTRQCLAPLPEPLDASILAGSVLGLTSPHIPALSGAVGARAILAGVREGAPVGGGAGTKHNSAHNAHGHVQDARRTSAGGVNDADVARDGGWAAQVAGGGGERSSSGGRGGAGSSGGMSEFERGDSVAGISRRQSDSQGRGLEAPVGQSLQDELMSVINKLVSAKIKLEKKRNCTLGLHGPWGESSVFIRITFTFPKDYAHGIYPRGTATELEHNPLILKLGLNGLSSLTGLSSLSNQGVFLHLS
ncbi:hypothetical protein B0H14DRAFT_3604271 [Mycena olivaceomarginata]|nr:hypothetical protein B0H14DRAFT_3604271 [Mycena olivaceomarginata]